MTTALFDDRDLVASLDAKAVGTARAMSALDPDWKERATGLVTKWAAQGVYFTSEDVTAEIGLPTQQIETNKNNGVGAFMGSMSRRGLIRKTDRRVPSERPSSHGAELIVWTGAEMTQFEARYFGECGGCDEDIEPGEKVEYRDGFVCHVDCKKVILPDLHPTCTTCWQVPSVSGVCGC